MAGTFTCKGISKRSRDLKLILKIDGEQYAEWILDLPKSRYNYSEEQNFKLREDYLSEQLFLAKIETMIPRHLARCWQMYLQVEAKHVPFEPYELIELEKN